MPKKNNNEKIDTTTQDYDKTNPDNKSEETSDTVVTSLEGIAAEQNEQIEKLQAELAEQKDARLRLAAEYENYRKRSQKEREMIYGDAYSAATLAFLPIIDNLERAVNAAYGDGGEAVREGVIMTLKQVGELCEKMGIVEIKAAAGDKFDPELHYAVMHEEDEKLGENVISEVLLKGYKVGERVIRPVTVKAAN